jgi:hypothetical protein
LPLPARYNLCPESDQCNPYKHILSKTEKMATLLVSFKMGFELAILKADAANATLQ